MSELNNAKHKEWVEQVEVLIEWVVRHRYRSSGSKIDMYWYIEKRTELELIKDRLNELHKKIEILY